MIRQRLREARFPEVKTLDTFDFAAVEGVSATQIHTLARGEWVTAPENLIFAGPIGTGKTHLAIALGVEATKQKRRVLFTRAADLVRQLLEARDTRSRRAGSRTATRATRGFDHIVFNDSFTGSQFARVYARATANRCAP